MEIQVIKDMQSQYLLIIPDKKISCGYQQKMVMHNQIEGLLRVELRCIDQEESYYYDVTSLKSVKSLYQGKQLGISEINFLLRGVIQVIQGTKQYLLQECNFILKPDTIYYDEEKVYLCYLEGYEVDIKEQLLELIEYLMKQIDYQNEKGVIAIYGLYRELREDACNFEQLVAFLEQVARDEYAEHPVMQEEISYIESNDNVIEEPIASPNRYLDFIEDKRFKVDFQGILLPVVIGVNVLYIVCVLYFKLIFNSVTGKLNIANTLIAILLLVGSDSYVWSLIKKGHDDTGSMVYELDTGEEMEGTVILSRSSPNYILVPIDKKLQSISISRYPFLIGKQNGAFGEYISKQHAIIEKNGERLFIKDLGSTNGTFLNGVLLEKNEQVEIKLKDSIIFAKDEYRLEEI